MGDRVSIQFKNGDDLSVVLFHHWGGPDFPDFVRSWVKTHKLGIEAYKSDRISTPIDRLDVDNLMVQFIGFLKTVNADFRYRHLISQSLYLGATENDGDNSDNGHHIIEVEGVDKDEVF